MHHEAPPIGSGANSLFGIGAAVSDFDRDGDQDLYVVDSYGWPNVLYRNNGDGTFTDIAEAAGVASTAYSHMALFLDLDNDGFDDLVVVNDNKLDTEYPGSQIYRNNGDSTFTDVTEGSGFAPVEEIWGGATAADYDLDGDLDLFLVGWWQRTAWLYRNEGGFQFTDVTNAAGARASGVRPQWAPVFADFDGDGWQDIFCAVDFTDDYLLRNNGDGTFTDVSEWAGITHEFNDMGTAVADFDDDLDLDIYTTNITGNGSLSCAVPYGCNMLYVNQGNGRFRDFTKRLRVGDSGWGWGTWFFDADLDGWRDLMAVNGWIGTQWHEQVYLFHNRQGRFVESAARAGIEHPANSRALIPIDIEDDGDIDVLISDVGGPLTLYENISPRGDKHWLTVVAEGTVSNRNGVGARVYVTAGGKTRFHEIFVGGSFYAGPPLEAHFGLGTATVADEVRVVFPSGIEVELTGVAVDQRLVVVEPLGGGLP